MGKQFVPLECNPEVFTSLIRSLGVSGALEFHDVYSIDDPDLLSFIPRPVYALLLVFPVSESYEKSRIEDEKDLANDYYSTISGTDKEDAVWMKQTIGNACGTYGLLHALANGIDDQSIAPGSAIDKILHDIKPLNVADRAHYLENSEELESQHAGVASKGDTEAPDAGASIEFHYVCLTRAKKSGNLYELDGRRKGPKDLGPLAPGEDMLGEKALNKVREYLKREGESGAFSIIALAPAL